MSIPAVLMPDPLILHLRETDLLELGIDPITIGIDSNLRFQALDDTGAAVSLSGITEIKMTFTKGSTSVSLSSLTEIAGGVFEIKADTNQTTEVGDTGKGWYQVNFSSVSAYITKMTPIIGRGKYTSDITFSSTNKRRHLKGFYDAL